MRVYLDDLRPCPEGWILARDYLMAISLLSTGKVTEISLDHDLGWENHGRKEPDEWDLLVTGCRGVEAKSGYDVMVWIEEKVFSGEIPMPKVKCHSANPAGRKRIESAIRAMESRHG